MMGMLRNVVLALLAASLSACAPVLFGGATAGGVVAVSERTAGAFIEDEGIEIKAWSQLSDEIGDRARYSVVSINRVALVVGQAPDQATRDRIVDIISDIENVRRVIDQMSIGPQISLATQGSDAVITTRIKTAFLGVQDEDFSTLNIKVLTEDGVVYLMGVESKKNAAKAVELTRAVSGVRQVIKAFEYLDE